MDRVGDGPAVSAQPAPEHELVRAKAELEASAQYAAALRTELADSERRIERLRAEFEHSQDQLRLLQAERAAPIDEQFRRGDAKGSLAQAARRLAKLVSPRR